jgi:alpha-tubulin suppressor-like RCC1 family protein
VGRAVVWTGNQSLVHLLAVCGPEGGHLMILRNGNYFAIGTAEHSTTTKLTFESQTVALHTTRFNILNSYTVITGNLCVLCGSGNKQQVLSYTGLKDRFL